MSERAELIERLARAIENPNGPIGKVAAAERVLDAFVVIPRADLPEVTRSAHDENTYYTERENVVYTSAENAQMWVMRDVAVWQFIVQHEASATVRRRDELAAEFGCSPLGYHDTFDSTQRAIDRIIELEGKVK